MDPLLGLLGFIAILLAPFYIVIAGVFGATQYIYAQSMAIYGIDETTFNELLHQRHCKLHYVMYMTLVVLAICTPVFAFFIEMLWMQLFPNLRHYVFTLQDVYITAGSFNGIIIGLPIYWYQCKFVSASCPSEMKEKQAARQKAAKDKAIQDSIATRQNQIDELTASIAADKRKLL